MLLTTPTAPSTTADPYATIKSMAALLNEAGFMLAMLLFIHGDGAQISTEQFKYFTGPVIFGKPEQAWDLPQEITEKLVKAARLERFWLILDELSGRAKPGQTCTAAELVCAIQPYTHVAPLSANLAAICVNAFGQVLEAHPELFPAGDASQFKRDITDPYERRDLQLTIRRKVVARGHKPMASRSEPDQPEAPQVNQISLF